MDQRREGQADAQELHQGRRCGDADHRRVMASRADERHGALRQRHAQGQDERVVTELGDHGRAAAVWGCQWPERFKASATSLGM